MNVETMGGMPYRQLLAGLLVLFLWFPAPVGLVKGIAATTSPVSKRIRVEDVALRYLDWGGSGDALLFVPGGCESGYIFSDIAPALRDRYRVLALTPRGCGESTPHAFGYDLDAQLGDLLAFLNALRIDRVVLAGHSSGGGKIVRFARMYPARVSRLVLFDTVYSFVAPGLEDRMAAAIARTVGGRSTDSAELFEAHHRAWELGAWSPSMKANLQATYSVEDDGTLKSRSAAGWYAAFKEDMKAGLYFESKVSHPTLMFFATNLDQQRVRQFDSVTRANLLPLAIQTDQKRLEQIEEFRRNGSHVKIVMMPETSHYCFVQRPLEIIEKINEFLDDTAL